MSEGFREAMAQARITLVLDGEPVLNRTQVRDFLGPLASPPPGKTAFSFPSRFQSCLFTAHREGAGNAWDRPPVGYFLPRGTQIDATLKDVPKIPPGVVVRVGGAGFHYSPDTEACGSGNTCRTK